MSWLLAGVHLLLQTTAPGTLLPGSGLACGPAGPPSSSSQDGSDMPSRQYVILYAFHSKGQQSDVIPLVLGVYSAPGSQEESQDREGFLQLMPVLSVR